VKRKLLGHGAAPYGYQWEGPRRERYLVIRPDEAKVVQLIFEWYVDGVASLRLPADYKRCVYPHRA